MDIQRINQYKNTFDYHFRELTKMVEYNIPEDIEEDCNTLLKKNC